MKTMRVGSLFAGIGGTCLGFKEAGFDVVWANECDKYAAMTYRENFPEVNLIEADIRTVDPDTLEPVDILVAGFPCQAFSIAGYRKGFEDERGNLFFDVLRFAKAMQPAVIFLENVKNLKTHDDGKTYKIIKASLECEGYYVLDKILNSMEYGNVPQNRERIYIVAFKSGRTASRFKFPSPIERTQALVSIIDQSVSDTKYFYPPGRYPSYDKIIADSVVTQNTCYQIRRAYIRENKSHVCPTLTANMGTGGHNVPIILTDHGVRKLTPRECLALQGFPVEYRLPTKMANSQLYKQAGNTVTVPVVARIAQQIKQAVERDELLMQEYAWSYQVARNYTNIGGCYVL